MSGDSTRHCAEGFRRHIWVSFFTDVESMQWYLVSSSARIASLLSDSQMNSCAINVESFLSCACQDSFKSSSHIFSLALPSWTPLQRILEINLWFSVSQRRHQGCSGSGVLDRHEVCIISEYTSERKLPVIRHRQECDSHAFLIQFTLPISSNLY